MIVNPQNLRGIYVGFNTLFNKALTTVDPLYKQIATVTPSTTDSETYAWLGDIPGMREWIGDREIQNLAASGYVIKNRDFELTVGIDRNAIEDDKISLYNPSVEMLAQSACVLLSEQTEGGATPFFTGLDKVRFKNSVRPGDVLETECTLLKHKGVFYWASGKGYVDGKLCVSAEFSFALIKE